MPPYIIYDIEQNTPEWHVWRASGLGASDAPTIMGENPWRTRDQLLENKLNQQPFITTEAIELGHELEPLSRKRYEKKTGWAVRPVCLRSREWPWMLASVDGMSEDGLHAVEIKSGIAAYNKTASTQKVPEYYRGQLQQQMAVTGLATMDFWCWWPALPAVGLRVKRNDAYIARLVAATKAFWDELTARRAA